MARPSSVRSRPRPESQRLITRTDATHIFDGLQSFPTHICHLQLGKTPTPLITWPIQQSDSAAPAKHSHSDMLEIALEWLTEDRDLRRRLEKEKGKQSRGARKTDVGRPGSFKMGLTLTLFIDAGHEVVLPKVRLQCRKVDGIVWAT